MMFVSGLGGAVSSLETGASYVNGQSNFSTSSVLATLGAAIGDLLIISRLAGLGTPALSSGNALTDIGASGNFYSRVLNSGDIAGTVTGMVSAGALLIYRGAASVVQVLTDTANAVTNRNAGNFTKNASHAGIVARLENNTAASTINVTSPPTFAQRALFDPAGISVDQCLLCDRLQPANPYYVSGTNILWSSSAASNVLRILELRS